MTEAELAAIVTAISVTGYGHTVTYTLQVTNHGPALASGISVIDTIPAGMSYASVTANQGSCTGASTITCNLGSLTNGASATVTIMARATTVGTKTNTATVSNAETDPNPANNTALAITTVLPRCSTGNYKITGAVREDSSDGSRIGGVALKLNGPSCGQIITTGTENYTFTGLKNGSYTLTPSKTGCTFTPASRSVTINNSNVSGWSRTGFAGSGANCSVN